MFDENFWFLPVFEEMILQPSKILDQKISDENFWFKTVSEEMIFQP
jgi:hypothetical protein